MSIPVAATRSSRAATRASSVAARVVGPSACARPTNEPNVARSSLSSRRLSLPSPNRVSPHSPPSTCVGGSRRIRLRGSQDLIGIQRRDSHGCGGGSQSCHNRHVRGRTRVRARQVRSVHQDRVRCVHDLATGRGSPTVWTCRFQLRAGTSVMSSLTAASRREASIASRLRSLCVDVIERTGGLAWS